MKNIIGKVIDVVDDKITSRGELEEHVSRRWEADNLTDSWLTKSSRHIIALLLTIATIVGWFVGLEMTGMVGLTGTVLTALFGARTFEKYQKINKK